MCQKVRGKEGGKEETMTVGKGLIEMGQRREREEKKGATVKRQRQDGKKSKRPKWNQRRKKRTGLSESCGEKARMKERQTERR